MDTSFLDNKSLLITGGTGSFGQAMARRLLSSTNIGRVIIFSRDEWKQWKMQEDDPIFRHPKIRFFLGDIRDIDRLKLALQDVQYVVHAAALKQVPAAEYNPTEFVKTNVVGAMNLSSAAMERNVEGVVTLSTDKAVNPINLYGATKLCSDKLMIAANSYVGKRGIPRFSVVRYGNVLGSRGSLLPMWKSLVDAGATSLPITDGNMTRFWITLGQAVDFVLMALRDQAGGELFVPKSPSVNIMQLKEALYPHVAATIVGVRPGEKIHEVLISQDDARHTLEFPTHYRILPAFSYQQNVGLRAIEQQGKPVPESFSLSSHTNPQLLTSLDQIRSLVASME